ncbi:EpsG family protein, partial [uncultured Spongiibacter sp.]|uniref:EpsG family protein n=1 Tax=uncultured Spongiibacter sp. TaxID=870896 RepID=UPI002592509A
FSMSVFLLYSVVTRYSGYDTDMITYANSLEYDAWAFYYLREPVYWVSSRYVYTILGSSELTFIFYDFLAFLFVFLASKKMSLPQYFPYLFLLFFPAVMGMNNVYRQYLSYCFFIYFISLCYVGSGSIRRSVFFLLSFFTHNVAALFAPMYFSLENGKKFNFKAISLALLVLMLLPIALSSKSSSETGELSVWVYLVALGALIVFLVASMGGRFEGVHKKMLYFVLYMFVLVSVSAALMGGAQSKRVGMFVLMVSLVPFVMVIEEKYKQKRLVRPLMFLVLISPSLIFQSSLNMLLTASH